MVVSEERKRGTGVVPSTLVVIFLLIAFASLQGSENLAFYTAGELWYTDP